MLPGSDCLTKSALGLGTNSEHGLTSRYLCRFCTEAASCKEKSKPFGIGVGFTGLQVKSTAPKASPAEKSRNQNIFCLSLTQALPKNIDALGSWAVLWQLKHPEIGLSTGPFVRPAHPKCAPAYAGISSEIIVSFRCFPAS